ncbi:MAG: ParA family protein [Casimicrobiaceae bacterium]|nr:ParA family protein [Casimicrobiaceae bacterium]MCX8099425.1 ParA family protein [Casimicrobiaceae bacterium]MDW8311814.1 ParA family protein [Burkholderiales bacterium]
MFTILVATAKGGAGKTTIATNLAAYLAGKRQRVALADLDRQRTAARWLARRPRGFPTIHDARALKEAKRLPEAGLQWLVVDTPAGLHGEELSKRVKQADAVLVPVAPSTFDFDATADFLAELTALKPIREGRRSVAIIGSRVDGRTVAAGDLDAFLAPLAFDVLTHIRDAQAYVHAAREGLSVFDLPRSRAEETWADWPPIFHWLQSLVRTRSS